LIPDLSRFINKRHSIAEVYPVMETIKKQIEKARGVEQVSVAGSVRRMKDTVGDIDFVVAAHTPSTVVHELMQSPIVSEVVMLGRGSITVMVKNQIPVDLLIVKPHLFGITLWLLTGTSDYVEEVKKLSYMNGLDISRDGIFDLNGRHMKVLSEHQLYDVLGIEWVPPEMRQGGFHLTNSSYRDFRLVEFKNLKGDLHIHTDSTDGKDSVEKMAYAANNFGLRYIAVTDHSSTNDEVHGLDSQEILDQAHKVAELNDKMKDSARDFRILTGAEVNILKAGSLDIPDNVLDKLDVVGAAIHSNFNESRSVQTERLIKAALNPNVDIIFHPTGRIINGRVGCTLDFDRIIDVARNTNTVLEINSSTYRLDLNDIYIRKCIDNRVKLVVNSDSHCTSDFSKFAFGLGQSRRARAKVGDILNTQGVTDFLKSLK
jgi:DNA polymerase (family X)